MLLHARNRLDCGGCQALGIPNEGKYETATCDHISKNLSRLISMF